METTDQTAGAATGAAVEVVEAAGDPARTARRLERKGAPVNRRLAGQVEDVARRTRHTAREVLDGTIPERLARDGLRVVKARARRRDGVGEATYRALELVSGGLGAAAKALGRLGEATQPPARTTRGRAAGEGAGRATRTRPAGRRTTARAGGAAAGAARPATARRTV